MAAKRPESSLQLLRTLLGLTSSPQPDYAEFRPLIFISIPTPSSKTKSSLSLTLTILDLLDISHVSPKNILSTHTFTTKLPRCLMSPASTVPYNGDSELIFATENHFSLSDLLPGNRDVVFISAGVGNDLQPTLTLIHTLGLPSTSKVASIFDMHEIAREVASLNSSFSHSIAKLLHRLQSPSELEVNVTEFVLRTAVLLVIESCKDEVRDEVGDVWVRCLKEVGVGKRIEKSSLETVRNGVKKVGNLVLKGVRRSKEEIEKVRAERAWKREVGGPVEVVDEMRLWDGTWEVVD